MGHGSLASASSTHIHTHHASPAGADGATYGWAAQQFVRVAAEALCAAMEAVWRHGKQRALVYALLLLPGSGVASPNERKVCVLLLLVIWMVAPL
eukprot:1160564-Pelagomonas_calceolata.AAC.11